MQLWPRMAFNALFVLQLCLHTKAAVCQCEVHNAHVRPTLWPTNTAALMLLAKACSRGFDVIIYRFEVMGLLYRYWPDMLQEGGDGQGHTAPVNQPTLSQPMQEGMHELQTR